MRMLLFFGVIIAAGLFIIYHMSQFFIAISNPKSRIKKDRRFAQVELNAIAKNVVPFEAEELTLISFEVEITHKKRAFHSESFGQIFTIYSEPLVAFYQFDYDDGRKLVMTKNSNSDIVFYKEETDIHIEVNGVNKYIVNEFYTLLDANTSEVVAMKTNDSALNIERISSNDSNIGNIENGNEDDNRSGRVFSSIMTESADQILINYCYSILNILNI